MPIILKQPTGNEFQQQPQKQSTWDKIISTLRAGEKFDIPKISLPPAQPSSFKFQMPEQVKPFKPTVEGPKVTIPFKPGIKEDFTKMIQQDARTVGGLLKQRALRERELQREYEQAYPEEYRSTEPLKQVAGAVYQKVRPGFEAVAVSISEKARQEELAARQREGRYVSEFMETPITSTDQIRGMISSSREYYGVDLPPEVIQEADAINQEEIQRQQSYRDRGFIQTIDGEEVFTGTEDQYNQYLEEGYQYQRDMMPYLERTERFARKRQESLDMPSIGTSLERGEYGQAYQTTKRAGAELLLAPGVTEALALYPAETAIAAGTLTFLGTTALMKSAPAIAKGVSGLQTLEAMQPGVIGVAKTAEFAYGSYLTGVPQRLGFTPFGERRGIYKEGTGLQKAGGLIEFGFGAGLIAASLPKPRITYGGELKRGKIEWLGRSEKISKGFEKVTTFPKETYKTGEPGFKVFRERYIQYGPFKMKISPIERDVFIRTRGFGEFVNSKVGTIGGGRISYQPAKVSAKLNKLIPIKSSYYRFNADVSKLAAKKVPIVLTSKRVSSLDKAIGNRVIFTETTLKPFDYKVTGKFLKVSSSGRVYKSGAGEFTGFLRKEITPSKVSIFPTKSGELLRLKKYTYLPFERAGVTTQQIFPSVRGITPTGKYVMLPKENIFLMKSIGAVKVGKLSSPSIFLSKKAQVAATPFLAKPNQSTSVDWLEKFLVKGKVTGASITSETIQATSAGIGQELVKLPKVSPIAYQDKFRLAVGTTFSFKPAQIEKLDYLSSPQVKLAQQQIPVQTTKFAFGTAQVTAPAQIQIVEPVLPTPQITPPTFKPPRPTIINIRRGILLPPVPEEEEVFKLKKPKIKIKKQRAYVPLIRRQQTWKVISKPTTKRRALKIGAKAVKTTLAASFKIKPTKYYTTEKEIDFKLSPKVFRKAKREKGVFVQRGGAEIAYVPGRRLASRGEIKEFKFFRKIKTRRRR